jgi:hypothetical protein
MDIGPSRADTMAYRAEEYLLAHLQSTHGEKSDDAGASAHLARVILARMAEPTRKRSGGDV